MSEEHLFMAQRKQRARQGSEPGITFKGMPLVTHFLLLAYPPPPVLKFPQPSEQTHEPVGDISYSNRKENRKYIFWHKMYRLFTLQCLFPATD
jgi:hypothetical protein